ncbi:MAG: glycosyltransferase [Chloroflexi bacterium]|nr:glycosyltransferase [Chloroflexota bacterium]
MPYQSPGTRRHNVQFGVGQSGFVGVEPTRIPQRILDAIPGAMAWLSLGVVILAAIHVPMLMLFGASLLALYSALRFLLAGIATIIGLRRVRAWHNNDWPQEYRRRRTETSLPLDAIHHVVIIPNYKEELSTLRTTLDRLAEQPNALDNVTIVLAMEAGDPDAVTKGEILKAEYERLFKHFFVPIHPKGIHNEMQCKSANQAWAARWAKRQLVDEMGYNIHHIVVTTMDADTLWDKHYLEALGVLFATDDQRYSAFWQAPIRYHSNVWRINPFMRLLHGYSSAWELAYLAAPWWQALPMSSYSLSLKLLDNSGYWDADVIADEWHMYIKAYFKREGDMVLRPIYLPFLASATGGSGIWDSIKQRYRQTLRHAWGAKEIGYTVSQSREHPYVGWLPSFRMTFRVAHDNLLAGAGWIIITAGTQLPALMHPELIIANRYSLPMIILQVSFAIISAMTLLFWIVDVRIRPPRPPKQAMTRIERLQTALSIPMLPTLTLVCVALPVLQAQTQLMLGVPLHFRVTKKV